MIPLGRCLIAAALVCCGATARLAAQNLVNTRPAEAYLLCHWRPGTECPGDVLKETAVIYTVPADSAIVPMRPGGGDRWVLNRVEVCCDARCLVRSEAIVTCSTASDKGRCGREPVKLVREERRYTVE
ncbi:MAG: hypothetical protein IT228_15535 [Flavobacteriales bacterium]|nr:hypothetical protein [Flavobacteriales bacterium]MCC6578752.1 hypothetical protein [Flavobacteriales bacterium]NUQ13793.1 hypothetical protein [Flavobacteriales bacterium]